MPSSALLSQKRVVTAPLDVLDRFARAPFPELRSLPPNRFRLRIGSGTRLLFNQHEYLLSGGASVAIKIFAIGLARFDSKIVDIGSGCGALASTLQRADAFVGTYTGIEVDLEMVDWCNERLSDGRFRFLHADVYSRLYNPSGSRGPYTIPLDGGTYQLVMGESLFTHLLEDQVRRYIEESHRLLEDGGHISMSVFCIDDMSSRGYLGGRWTFSRRLGNAYVENLKYPEAAVAYERAYLEANVRAAGFSEVQVTPSLTGYNPQSLLVARK